jgi:large subunit ribosomal protein L22e
MPAAPRRARKSPVKIVIDCSRPVEDKIYDVASFEKFLHDRIKVEGRTGNLGDTVTITRQGSKIIIDTKKRVFPKRYIKFLIKKYLKKHSLRDWLRVIAVDKVTYELRYYNIADQDEDEEEEDEE